MMKFDFKHTLMVLALMQTSLYAVDSSKIKQLAVNSKSKFIKSVYSTNLYEPIWIKGSSLSNLGKELIDQIDSDKTVSYDLPFYKLYKSVKKDIKNGNFSEKLEFKMLKLYKAYMDYLIKGGINWNKFDSDIAALRKKYDYLVSWEHYAPPYSTRKVLDNAMLAGSFGSIFSKVEPKRFKYAQLKEYLVKFLQIRNSGGWGRVKTGAVLRPGSSSSDIPVIRKHLKLVGDLGNCSSSMDSLVYDNCMAKAVKRFRLRHGLKASSAIDKAVRTELNHPVSYYIRKIRLNLDRIKWLKREEARVRIELNIPAFRLYIYDGKDLVTTMRVVTGKPDHPTPVFSDVMTTVVVNPYWRIPESIVKKEMLKHLIKNPHYYERQGKFLYKGWGPNSEKINPATVNWRQYLNNKKRIPYHFMQNPGYKNALGKIKFLFPNKYSVYIHDTPSKRLFFREVRAFSHGCMRIQKPRELLKALSLYNSNLNVEKIMKKLGTNENEHIPLRRKIPIDITYLTSFVDDYGNLHFRRDIYGYDRLQLKYYNKGYSALAETKDGAKNKNSKNKKTKKKKENKKLKKELKRKTENTAPKKEAKKTDAPKPKQKSSGYEVIEIGY